MKRLETQARHAIPYGFEIVGVTRQARGLPAFSFKLGNGLMQCHDHVCWWCKAPLAGLFQVDILVVQDHGQRLALADAAVEQFLANENKTHTGQALQALATGGKQCVKACFSGINFQRTKGTHGIDDQAFAKRCAA